MSSRMRVMLLSAIPTGAAILYLIWTLAWKKNKLKDKEDSCSKSAEATDISKKAGEIMKSDRKAILADNAVSDNCASGTNSSRHLSGSDAGNFSLSDELELSSWSCGHSLGAGDMIEGHQRSSTELDAESDDIALLHQSETKAYPADADSLVFSLDGQDVADKKGCSSPDTVSVAIVNSGSKTEVCDVEETAIVSVFNQQTCAEMEQHLLIAENDAVKLAEEEATVSNILSLESAVFGQSCEAPIMTADSLNSENSDNAWGNSEMPSAWAEQVSDVNQLDDERNAMHENRSSQSSIDGNGNEFNRQTKKTKNVDDRKSKDNSLKAHSFDFPTEFCGQLIGKRGHNVKLIKEKSGVEICIQPKMYNMTWQVVTLEGTRQQVNKALDMIRRKFPSKYYPGIDFNHCLPDMPLVPADVMQLMLPTGVPLEVVVCHVYTPNHVFVQQPTHPTFPSLERQTINMNECYKVDDVPGLPRPVGVGIICAAPVGNDWYRAQVVQSYPDTDECTVKLVDYGGYINFPCSSLRQIRADFMSMPFQAIECYLSSVIPPKDDDDFSAEAKAALEDLVKGCILQCTVTAYEADGVPYIELIKLSDKGKQAVIINRELVRREYAQWLEM